MKTYGAFTDTDTASAAVVYCCVANRTTQLIVAEYSISLEQGAMCLNKETLEDIVKTKILPLLSEPAEVPNCRAIPDVAQIYDNTYDAGFSLIVISPVNQQACHALCC